MIQMKTYMMTLKRMMMTVLMMLITVSAMRAEQKIWLHISGNGKAQVSLGETVLTFDKDNMTTVKEDAPGKTVTVSVKPDNGYKVASVTAQLTTSADNADTRGADDAGFLTVKKASDTEYTFEMPKDFNVSIYVTFSKKGGDSKGPDYSGTYYIGVYGKSTTGSQYALNNPENNYYLCPTEGWCFYNGSGQVTADDNGQPFITSFQCRNGVYNATKAMWTIEKVTSNPDYYYIKQASTGKYLVYNVQLSGAGANRARVHLETITSPAVPDDNALFAISTVTTTDDRNGYWLFHPKSATDGYYLNITEGNFNSLTPTTNKTDGPTNYKNVGGIVGQWNETNNTSSYYLEQYSPFITYNASNLITITALAGSTIYYTTNGDTPSSSNGTLYSAPFSLDDNVTEIKAIAYDSGNPSAVATFTPIVLLGSTHERLIQSQHYNTDKVSWTEPCYYMIPSDVASNNTTVNTTTLLQPTMGWFFLNAGNDGLTNQYYYIVNSNGKNLCYDGGVYMQDFDSENADKFKFSIAQYPTTGTPTDYNILPYGFTSGNRFVNKSSGNDNVAALNLGNSNGAGTSRWKFIKKADFNSTLPFNVSDNNNTYYYKLSTNATPAAFITPPASGNYVTTNTTESANQNWYLVQVEAATNDDWLTYYNIRNAVTGKYLYYNGAVNSENHVNAFELHNSIDSEADRYKFAMARATIKDRWYIVPKVLKGTQFANISSIWKDGNNALKTQINRSNGNAMWMFTSTDLFCMPPVFTEADGAIKMSCITNASEIHYSTNGDDPKTSGTTYTYPPTDPLSVSDQYRIKAYAVVSDGTTTAFSDVITLLNKPDCVLDPQDTYTYDGTAHEPTITKVSIGEGGSKTEVDITGSPTHTYTNNTNAGTATVTLGDVEDNNMYIWNISKNFTIEPAVLTITADAKEKTYGEADPELTYTQTGLVTGDNLENVLTGALSRVAGDNAGTYAINQNTLALASTNYTLSFNGAIFTINPKDLSSADITIGITKSGDAYTVTVKDGETTLNTTDHYTLSVVDSNPKYYVANVTGKYDNTLNPPGNYTGTITAKYVNVAFSKKDPEDNTEKWSATFVIDSGEGKFSTPAGFTPHIVTAINHGNVTLSAINYIPEEVPVLLLSDSEATGFVAQTAGDDAIDTSGNKLMKADKSYPTDNPVGQYFGAGTIYLLYEGEFVLNMAGTLTAGKVYLQKSSGAGTRLAIFESRTTDIKGATLNDKEEMMNDKWYSLDGRRLSGKPTKKGVYIINGKKAVVK